MKISRRKLLLGAGGAVLSLPFLESFQGNTAKASDFAETFAIFFRQANGVAQQWNMEPERFWPRDVGVLTEASMADRATGQLAAHRDHLLMVQGVNMNGFDYADGHARGAMQSLTAAGAQVPGEAGRSEAGGQSLDDRIARQLNPDGRDPLVLYAGRSGGWLGGPCLSYYGPGLRNSAITSPWAAYMQIVGGEGGLSAEAQLQLVRRQQSINDLVRHQMDRLLAHPRLSTPDRARLERHRDSIRDLELSLSCQLSEDEERVLEGSSESFNSSDGDDTLLTARLHMDVAVLAVACGYTRSVVIQVGNGNDGHTRYRNLDTGMPMANYHYLSHRRESHGSDGTPIPGADILHHYVDVQFAQTFGHLVSGLREVVLPDGETLLDQGVACWHNDNANGPPHSSQGVPWIIAGSAKGRLQQGVMLDLMPEGTRTHDQLLNTIGAVVGATNADGTPLSRFGQNADQVPFDDADEPEERGQLSALLT